MMSDYVAHLGEARVAIFDLYAVRTVDIPRECVYTDAAYTPLSFVHLELST